MFFIKFEGFGHSFFKYFSVLALLSPEDYLLLLWRFPKALYILSNLLSVDCIVSNKPSLIDFFFFFVISLLMISPSSEFSISVVEFPFYSILSFLFLCQNSLSQMTLRVELHVLAPDSSFLVREQNNKRNLFNEEQFLNSLGVSDVYMWSG